MAFNVKYSEVQDLQNEYQQYETDLREAEYALNDRILELVGLETFQGAGANTIKSYFSEVHQKLLCGLDSLTHQLATEYGDHYYTRFEESPISETNANAQWPSSAMNDARKALVSLRDGDLDSAERSLQRAIAAMPAEFQFNAPSAADAKAAMTDEIEHQKKVRDAVKAAEEEGARTFESASSDFSAMRASLASLIASCGKGAYTVTNYVPGSFQSLMEETGFIDAYNSCAQYQSENAEMLAAAREDSIAKKQVRIEQAAQEEAKKKAFWSTVGLVASAIVLVGAAAALVTTAGAAAPLLTVVKVGLGVLEVGTAAADFGKRANQVSDMIEGDIYASRTEEDETLETIATYSKEKLKYETGELEGNILEAGGRLDEAADARKTARSDFLTYVMGEAREYTYDTFIQDEETKAYFKAGDEIISEGVDQISEWYDAKRAGKSFQMKGAGVASAIGKGGTIVADYYEGEADKRLESLRDESNNLNDMRQKTIAQQSYDWGISW